MGHPYFIGECGGPMEETNCPVEGCTERIGGDRMELLRSNRSIKFSSEELINVCNFFKIMYTAQDIYTQFLNGFSTTGGWRSSSTTLFLSKCSPRPGLS